MKQVFPRTAKQAQVALFFLRVGPRPHGRSLVSLLICGSLTIGDIVAGMDGIKTWTVRRTLRDMLEIGLLLHDYDVSRYGSRSLWSVKQTARALARWRVVLERARLRLEGTKKGTNGKAKK